MVNKNQIFFVRERGRERERENKLESKYIKINGNGIKIIKLLQTCKIYWYAGGTIWKSNAGHGMVIQIYVDDVKMDESNNANPLILVIVKLSLESIKYLKQIKITTKSKK